MDLSSLEGLRGCGGAGFQAAFKWKAVRDEAGVGTPASGGGLIWRAQDPDNYYVARANPLEDNLRLYTVKDGHRHELASADLPLAADTWYRLRIDHHGDHIQVSLDGKAYLDFHDHTFPQAGAIGYWTKADAATSFTGLAIAR